ncbi:hypothetical protein MNBD_NITROSPINAE03-250 [hydrothermal vent metagenome]|uniref:Magnesium transporter MgtE intracellular domain-containing protein n=1 Tax=hydrothermal vent metagenome TaxID=652676 RepID=A0A3B1BP54_9ZZZZ
MRKTGSTFRKKLIVSLGALMLIKIILIGAEGLVVDKPFSAYSALAQESQTGGKNASSTASSPEEATSDPAPRTPGPGELDLEIIKDVEKRNKELDLKEEKLKREKERIDTMKLDIDAQISELKALQAKIDEQIKLRDDLQKVSIKKLAKTYAAMPPENAAALIQQIDISIAIRVLGAMKERSAGKILAVIPPKLASTLSEGLVRKK